MPVTVATIPVFARPPTHRNFICPCIWIANGHYGQNIIRVDTDGSVVMHGFSSFLGSGRRATDLNNCSYYLTDS